MEISRLEKFRSTAYFTISQIHSAFAVEYISALKNGVSGSVFEILASKISNI